MPDHCKIVGDKKIGSWNLRCKSSSRLMIWPWIETSSADTASSQHDERRLHGQSALRMPTRWRWPSRKLMRITFGHVTAQSDIFQ